MTPSNAPSIETLKVRYRVCTDRLLTLVGKATGAPIPRPSTELAFFETLPLTDQTQLVDLTELLVSSAEALTALGVSPLESEKLAQAFLERASLHTTVDAYDSYRQGDFVEVYLSNGQSIFSSLNILSLSSYSIEELQCRPWTALWYRDEAITTQLLSLITTLLTNGEQKTEIPAIPTHQIYERESAARRTLWIQNKSFSPVWTTDGVTVGFICINEARSQMSSLS